MIKFNDILSSVTPADFKFVNQRFVKVVYLSGFRVISYQLTKADVILAIKEYTKRVHSFSDRPIRSEGMNFNAFKMHDLVPYLYTLINLFISVGVTSYDYHRFLPELKLTCSCHLPFEDEIILPTKPDLVVMCSLLPDALTGKSYYMCFVDHFSYSSESVENLLSDIRSCDPYLFRTYNVILKVVGSHGKE